MEEVKKLNDDIRVLKMKVNNPYRPENEYSYRWIRTLDLAQYLNIPNHDLINNIIEIIEAEIDLEFENNSGYTDFAILEHDKNTNTYRLFSVPNVIYPNLVRKSNWKENINNKCSNEMIIDEDKIYYLHVNLI